MRKPHEEWIGKSLIRVVEEKDGSFAGLTIRDKKGSDILRDAEFERLLTRLRNEAGKLEPGYHGMAEAIRRFLKFMPGGFAGKQISCERTYKVEASETLRSVLPLEQALTAARANADAVRKAVVWINLLSPYESMHLKEAMEGPDGPNFLIGAARFASGEMAAGITLMRKAMKNHGPLTWPIATFFAFLWDPSNQMFLKPTVTRDFAARVGHPFQYQYTSEIEPQTYDALLALTADTKAALARLQPTDNIDVQSFIWVVGGYTEADMPNASD